jgi:hypothetical protein
VELYSRIEQLSLHSKALTNGGRDEDAEDVTNLPLVSYPAVSTKATARPVRERHFGDPWTNLPQFVREGVAKVAPPQAL